MGFVRSRYTLAEPWPEGRGLLLNTFSGAVDIVSRGLVDFVRGHRSAELEPGLPEHEMLVERGYFVESQEVEEAVARRVAARAKELALRHGEPKYMFGLTLRCNLACKYCWQVIEHGQKRQETELMSEEMVDAAFSYIDEDLKARGQRRAFISLFGGEPLLDAPESRRLVRAIGDRAAARGLHLHFTTNGLALAAFREEVRLYRPSIQVTIDGVRMEEGRVVLLRDGQELPGLYELLGELAAEGCAQLFLRVLVTQESVPGFVALADAIFAEQRFSGHFTLAVAPIQNKTDVIDPEVPPKFKVLRALMDGLRGRPHASRIAYVDWRSLNLFSELRAGSDTLPEATFYHCEANVDLTCFDQEGRLYACYEAIGNPRNAVGTYWPRVELDAPHLAQYRERSAFSMPECTECALSPICGGGCEVRGYKKNGTYMQPFCDALHAEVRQTMRSWEQLSDMLIGRPA